MQQMLCLVIEILFEFHSGQSDALVGAGGFSGAQFADLDAAVEVAAARQTERGTRADDRRSETAMEDRKKQGYF